MTTETPDSKLREEIRVVEAELAELRRTAVELRRGIGSRSDGPNDAEDTAAAITSAEEQEALIGVLEARRERLQNRLTQS